MMLVISNFEVVLAQFNKVLRQLIFSTHYYNSLFSDLLEFGLSFVQGQHCRTFGTPHALLQVSAHLINACRALYGVNTRLTFLIRSNLLAKDNVVSPPFADAWLLCSNDEQVSLRIVSWASCSRQSQPLDTDVQVRLNSICNLFLIFRKMTAKCFISNPPLFVQYFLVEQGQP